MKKANIVTVMLVALSWAALINNTAVHILGDTIFNQIIGLFCGISIGLCIGIGCVVLMERVKKK